MASKRMAFWALLRWTFLGVFCEAMSWAWGQEREDQRISWAKGVMVTRGAPHNMVEDVVDRRLDRLVVRGRPVLEEAQQLDLEPWSGDLVVEVVFRVVFLRAQKVGVSQLCVGRLRTRCAHSPR